METYTFRNGKKVNVPWIPQNKKEIQTIFLVRIPANVLYFEFGVGEEVWATGPEEIIQALHGSSEGEIHFVRLLDTPKTYDDLPLGTILPVQLRGSNERPIVLWEELLRYKCNQWPLPKDFMMSGSAVFYGRKEIASSKE